MIRVVWLFLRSRVGPFLKGVPWWVWAALVAGFIVWRGIAWHERVVKQAISAAETRGETREKGKWQKLMAQAQARAAQVSREERKRYDEAVARVDRRADAVLVQGPGRAAYNCPAPSAASGRNQAPAGPGPAVAGVPDTGREQFIVMPFEPTVSLIRNHDRLLEEATRWRSQHQQLTTSSGR